MPKLAAIGQDALVWGARAWRMGWDVAVFGVDHSEATRVFAQAERQFPALYDVALPRAGDMSLCDDLALAAQGAELVICGAPFETVRDIRDAAPKGTPVLLIAGDAEIADIRRHASDKGLLSQMKPAGSALVPLVGVDASLTEFEHVRGLFNGFGVECCPISDLPGVIPSWLGGADGDDLISVLRALKARKAGVGAVLAAHEAMLAPQGPSDLSAPLLALSRQVPPDWVDYNGHMNEARYLTAFSDATDRVLLWAGMDADCISEGHSVFTVETHIRHLGEVDIGDSIEVHTRVLDGTGKRLHLWHELRRGETLAATAEQLLLHVDLKTRRVGHPRADVGAWLEAAQTAQADLPAPDGLGRFVGAPR